MPSALIAAFFHLLTHHHHRKDRVADRFSFTGQSTLGYFSYADTDTGRMLVADPGGTYGIRATEQGLVVPPPDGRWTSAEAVDAPSWSPPPVPDLEPALTATTGTEGSEA